jgi:hypothetical protein
MIKYAVQCKKGHGFEAWFQNSAAFDTQTKRGLVACPECGSTKVEKALMAPHVSASTRNKGSTIAPRASINRDERETTVAPAESTASQVVASPAVTIPAEMAEVLRKIRREVEAKSEYVGPKFAEEARKIHYEEAPERGIYGEASLADVKALHDEGIDCLPLPILPEDRN